MQSALLPRLVQATKLSPQMLRSVRILQMSIPELDRFVREMAVENPLMDIDPYGDERERASVFSIAGHPGDDDDEEDFPLYERNAGRSLQDDLRQQLAGLNLNPDVERLVRLLIESLDERGYFAGTAVDWAVGEGEFWAALSVLQSLDPPGVGARDLKECLSLQVRRLESPPLFLFDVIENHLNLLATNRLDLLARKLKISVKDVEELRKVLLTLNPHPGNGYFSSEPIPYIVPDVLVLKCAEGFEVISGQRGEPRIALNGYYRKLAENRGDVEASAWLRERLKQAEWAISCIRQRMETIVKCATTVIRRQRGFFERGPGNLVPLSLSDVADELGMHVSTVSRSTCGKYLQCQWGVFALSAFFSRSLKGKEKRGDDVSQETAKLQIGRIIADENTARPLSDGAVARILQRHGVVLARRTVTKYREQLRIPVAALRKKF